MDKNTGAKKTLNNLTAELVKNKMELSYFRLKELYQIKNLEIEKMEEKMAKMNEKVNDLKMEREKLEDELNGLYESYICYCGETELQPAFEGAE
ncbi:MAG: hypothetical protein RDV48_01940 [Candidatus Eremiobacteraeota bacterium]|nr:hypothetical protein [Candidatus Eremiobacteraeota bacterium]